ncbi:MAG: 3D-(3,5/4)-trihydroxycyclohexane-1,2-dione acylhydrolase (decyclizing) [Spirochaetales bacterium]|nr:3D-(3,5/4)-trihydroxycyclohexane-1,2-dione acylhydrolase (decyclizing) [Spirochaetales bacterium]
MKTERMTMAQALVRFLDSQYVEMDGEETKFVHGVFGIFGHGSVVGLGEALAEQDHALTFYQGHNEQGMAHAAIAYAKQRRRRQIFAVVSSIGPGALNMVTAAGVATVNRIPVLFLPGDAFACRQPDPVLQQVEQDYNHNTTANEAFIPVSKYWDRVSRPDQLMTAGINAMRVLTDPAETGAVTLCLPQDVQGEAYDYPLEFFEKRIHHIDRQPITEDAAQRAAALFHGKRRPLIICGGGVRYSGADEELASFAQKFQIPVAETQAGKGCVVWDHPMNLGGIGVTGTLCANRAARDADLVISVGTRLGDFTTGSKLGFQNPNAEIITINVNRFDAYKMNATPVVADAKVALQKIAKLLEGAGYRSAYGDEVQKLKTEWNAEVDRLYSLESGEGMAQTRVLGELNERLMQENAIVVGASGSLPGDMQRVWRPRQPDTYHMEYGFSCMGYEVAAALGAKLAEPHREVYAMVGDGSYVMLHSELLTSIQENIKINVLVFDNRGFQCIDNLQVSQGIESFGTEFRYRDARSGRLTGDYIPIDFAANGRSYGARAYTVTNVEELTEAMQKAREDTVSVLIDVKVLPKSMTHDYESWWRVGTPEVSRNEKVRKAYADMKSHVEKARKY